MLGVSVGGIWQPKDVPGPFQGNFPSTPLGLLSADSSTGGPGNESNATKPDGADSKLSGPCLACHGCASWERTLVMRPQPSASSGAPIQDPLQLSLTQTQGYQYPLQKLEAQAPSKG